MSIDRNLYKKRISIANLCLLFSSTILLFLLRNDDKIARFTMSIIPLLMLDTKRRQFIEHVVLVSLPIFGVIIIISWNLMNEIGRVIFPFTWIIVSAYVIINTYFPFNRRELWEEEQFGDGYITRYEKSEYIDEECISTEPYTKKEEDEEEEEEKEKEDIITETRTYVKDKDA